MPKNKGRGGARQSAATPGASTSTATGPIASTSVAPDPVLEVKIFCWVLDLSKSAFSVTIEDNLTVDDLKTAIRNKKQALAEVDADDLTLWKRYIEGSSLSEPQSENLHLCLCDEVPLGAVQILSSAIPDPPQGHIHVIVRAPLDTSPARKRVRLAEPLTPIKTQAALPETKVTPPRLPRQQFELAMNTALQPFAQYITNLAKGQFDGYFNSSQPGPLVDVELQKSPIVLLHSLGSCPDDPRLAGLFKPDTVHLFGVSGSGKTRLSLEGLCHAWGLYISCRGGSRGRAAGSSDFASAIDKMSSMSKWDRSTNHNIDSAHRAFVMLICARVFVLKCLLYELPSGTPAETARRRWVLLQVMPPFDDIDDIFVVVLGSLHAADRTDMMDFTKSMLKEMKMHLGNDFFPNKGLFAVVDEAQVATEYLNESFRSTTTETEKHPVLHPFYSFLWNTKLFQGVILAGTGLSMKMVRTAVTPQALKLLEYRREPFVFVEIGRFTKDGTEHKAYIEKYLRLSRSVSEQRLRERILYWFHGRYRFTAALIELLRSAPPGSPHSILSAFVHSVTGFKLTDAVDLEEGERSITKATHDQIAHYGQIVGANIFEQVDILKHIFHAVMLWRIRSQSTFIRIDADMHQTIALGIGHLEKVGPDQTFDEATNYPVYLCEPLVVLSLSSILSKRPDTTTATMAHNNLARGFVLEEAILLVLLEMLGGKECALSDVFDTDQPWGSRKVTLVSLKRGSDGRMRTFPVSWDSGSSDRLGYKASSPEDVVKFLNNPDGKCFLFPDDHMGPDLLCFVQDVVTKELIFLCLESKLSKKLSAEAALGALASVDPEFFYSFKKDGDQVIYAPSKHPDLVDDVMAALVPKVGSAEYEPLVEGIRKKLRSSSKTDQKFMSQSQRSTPRYLRIIATRDAKRAASFKADSKGDVGVLRWECVDQLFEDVMWDS